MTPRMFLPAIPTSRKHVAFVGVLALLIATCLAALASPTVAYASAPALSVSPTNYVGGQLLRWTGNVGHPGARTLRLQFHMGRPGDTWTTIEGFRSRTKNDGSFDFRYPAPGMFNIKYRVKAGSYYSEARLFVAKTQELTIRLSGQPENKTNEPGRVEPDQKYAITVDTTPENIYRTPSSQGLPVFTGRVLTLQERISGDVWNTLQTTTVDSDGNGHFAGLSSPAGTTVYRVRQENYFTDGNKIGWTQSFPLYVLSGRQAQQDYQAAQRSAPPAITQSLPVTERSTGLAAGPTASQRYRWTPSTWDFAWESGESLSSGPYRGTARTGHWIDYSDGAGRVSKQNGGLGLDSKRYLGAGPGDFGTTRATMVGNDTAQGRWEARMRIRNASEHSGRDYKILAELVPTRDADYDCGSHNITIASISPTSSRVQFGVRSPTSRWDGSATASTTPVKSAYAVAVEVSKKHITWFLNGAPVGTVTDPAALSKVPMTLRLSLEGDGHTEMNQVALVSDWQRGFPIDTGSLTKTKKRLVKTAASTPGC